MTRSKRGFGEAERIEMTELGRDVRRRCVALLARLPIGGEPYATVSNVLDAANALLIALDAENWRGRNSIGR